MEVVRGKGIFPNDFEVPARVAVGSGDDATFDPDKQEDLVLVDLTKDPDSTVVKPHLDEHTEISPPPKRGSPRHGSSRHQH